MEIIGAIIIVGHTNNIHSLGFLSNSCVVIFIVDSKYPPVEVEISMWYIQMWSKRLNLDFKVTN